MECNGSVNDVGGCCGGHVASKTKKKIGLNLKHCSNDDGNFLENCKIKCGDPNPPHGLSLPLHGAGISRSSWKA
ncbi:unnamed protein product, partial [Thlaspi arvense]